MVHSIRVRLILIFIGLAVVPLLAAGIILAWLSQTWQAAPTVILAVVMLILTILAAGIAGGLGLLVARRIIEPIQALTEAANAIGSDDLASRSLVPTDDEIGILTGTFNNVSRQVRVRIGSLEHRAAEQTKALATFREVSRLAAMLDEKQMVAEVLEKVQTAFHYSQAHLYFYDEAGENLILAGATGEADQKLLAEGYAISKGQGPAGRAAESNTPVLIGDTSRDPNGLPKPLLSKAQSEAAIPIALGDRVLGVLDVRQNIEYGITQADANLLQSIANQVALAVRNTRLAPDRQQAEREALIASISRKIQETTSIENAMRVAALELGRALGAGETRVVISASPQAVQTGFNPDGGH